MSDYQETWKDCGGRVFGWGWYRSDYEVLCALKERGGGVTMH